MSDTTEERPLSVNKLATEELPLSINELCKLERISRSKYMAMRRAGLGPAETRYPDITLPDGRIKQNKTIRITPQARRDWHEKLAEWQNSAAAQLEQARASERAKLLGKLATKSEQHISKRAKRRA